MSYQILFPGRLNRSLVGGKDPGQRIALEPYQGEHGAAKGEADANAGEHGLSGTFFAACPDILRDKRCHRLHQCAGDQHGKVDDLAGHTVTGRCFQPKTVDEGAECKERELGQKLLQSQRQTDAEEFAALGIQAEISLAKFERQVLFQQHDHCAHHADSLRCHCGNGCTGGIQMQPGHQKQIAENIHDAGYKHKQQGDWLSPRPRKIAASRL